MALNSVVFVTEPKGMFCDDDLRQKLCSEKLGARMHACACVANRGCFQKQFLEKVLLLPQVPGSVLMAFEFRRAQSNKDNKTCGTALLGPRERRGI